MHGWRWGWVEHGGRKANWPHLGGSSGGDDQLCNIDGRSKQRSSKHETLNGLSYLQVTSPDGGSVFWGNDKTGGDRSNNIEKVGGLEAGLGAGLSCLALKLCFE